MPSNDQLKADIAELSEKLGIDTPDTSEQNNAQMSATLKKLNTQQEAADAKAAQEAADAKAAQEAADAKAKKPEFYVLEGRAVTSKRGIRSDGDEITVNDLAGGKPALTALIKAGLVARG